MLSWSQTYLEVHAILHKLTQNLLSIPFTPNIWKLRNHFFLELMIEGLESDGTCWKHSGLECQSIAFRSASLLETNLQVWVVGLLVEIFPYSFINDTYSLLYSLFIYSCFILMDESWTELFEPNITADCCQKGVPVVSPQRTFFLFSPASLFCFSLSF